MKSKEIARKFIIGIDEAGRGPLAGPVVVAGVLMSPRLAAHVLVGIKDSKQLSAKQREAWFETIIKGDELIPIISAASIIAKVTRDRIMLRLHKKYPHYRFDLHKGYGTKLHREMVRKFGKCEIHRKSFSFH